MAYVKSYKKGTYFEIPKGNAGKKSPLSSIFNGVNIKG